jgi:hypothetical protein
VNTAGNIPLGWVTQRIKDGDNTNDADYAVADVLKVVRGAGAIIAAVLENGSSAVVPGDALTTGANGTLKKATALSATVPAGATAVTSSSAQPAMTMAGGIPPQPIVAYAMESADPSSAEVFAAVMLAI